MANLTRVGAKGLELTREEVIDITSEVTALIRKAQCREVNYEVIDRLDDINKLLADVDECITKILEGNE